MVMDNEYAPAKEGGEEEEPAFDFWSDEGARRFNESSDEGIAYIQAGGHLPYDPEDYVEEEDCEYRDPELCDPDEEILPPGEMELIFENSFIN